MNPPDWNQQLVRLARGVMGVWARQWRAVRRDRTAAAHAAWCLQQAITWREQAKRWANPSP